MNWFDLLLIMLLLTGLFWGTWKGLVRQVLSLAGLVLGLLLALNFYSIPAVALNLPPGIAELVGFALIFFSVSLVAMLLSKLIDKLLKAVSLSWLNRLGGGLLGFFKGAVIMAFLAFVLVAFLPAESPFLKTSRTLPVVLKSLDWVRLMVPADLESRYFAKLSYLKNIPWHEGGPIPAKAGSPPNKDADASSGADGQP